MFDGQLVDIYNAQQQPMRVAVAVFSAIIQAMYLDCSAFFGYFARHFWGKSFGTFGINSIQTPRTAAQESGSAGYHISIETVISPRGQGTCCGDSRPA